MSKQINIKINRNDKQSQEIIVSESELKDVKDNITPELSVEELYIKEFELVIDGYGEFSQTYKNISKKMMNPIRVRKEIGSIYEELKTLSENFNQTIHYFRKRANPPEDLLSIHQDTLKALENFEVYNNEFPEMMISGNLKRLTTLSKRFEDGRRILREVMNRLEERVNQ